MADGGLNIQELAREWMENWNRDKVKIAQKLSKADYQIKWKKNTLSPKAVKARRENLIKAVEAGLIEEGLAEVDPAEWAEKVIKGVETTEVTMEDAERWATNVAPYLAVVEQGKRELERLGLTGKQAMDWWYENVSKKLKQMKYQKRELEYSKARGSLIVPVE